MSNELDAVVAKLLLDSAESVSEAKAFVLSELPDVIQQLLVWHATRSVLLTMLGLFILLTPIMLIWKYGGKGEPMPNSLGEYYADTLTHDYQGKLDLDCLLWLALPISLTTLAGILLINIDWLQIWIAPKLYIIEYARGLL